MYLRPRMTRYGGHAGPYVWGGVTGVTDRDNPWLSAVQENTATRLVVAGSSYDAEQRFLVNENPLSVRTALGVGLGSAGCAGPVFAPDKYGSAMWLDQSASVGYVSANSGTFTDEFEYTIEGSYAGIGLTGSSVYRILVAGGLNIKLSSGKFLVYDGAANRTATNTVTTDIGVTDWDRWWWRIHMNGTVLNAWVSADNWETSYQVFTDLACNAYSMNNRAIMHGGTVTTQGSKGRYYNLTVRDGAPSASKVAEFTPGLFVGGNRADGDTAVDAYGVTWTIERPAATTDMPRVMVGRTEQYISLPGVSGEYVSTPDTAANSITGDIDIRVRVSLDDWTPSAINALVAKIDSGTTRSFWFAINTAGKMTFVWSVNGSSELSSTGSAVMDGTYEYLRVTLDADNGASGATVTFYYSTDGVTWVTDAVDIKGATTSIFDSTSPIEVGSRVGGTQYNLQGNVYWAEVYDGIDGTLVERIDASEANANATTWTSSTSGATVTVNKSASAQYHATVVPAGTTIVQGDGVNDFAQVVGDDTITDFVPGTGLTLVLDASFSSGAGSGGVFASSANATTDDGLIVSRNSTNPRVQGRLDDGTTIATVGDNANNVTYSDRFQATFAFGSSDHEAYVDGVSVEAATNAVTAETAAGALRFGAEINGSNPAAFDLYGAAVLGERTSDTEAAAYATEGLTR